MNDCPSDLSTEELINKEWWRLNAALANYEGYIAGGKIKISAFAYLVCQVLSTANLPIMNIVQINSLLKKEFGANWEPGEINGAIKELKHVGYIEELCEEDKTRYSVIENYKEESTRIQKETLALRYQVFDEWVSEVKERHPDLDDDQCQLMIQDLLDFFVKVFDRYGAECAALIYGEDKKEKFLETLEKEDIHNLVDREKINNIRNVELMDFFRNSDGKRSQCIGHFLTSSFLKSAISIDPKFMGTISKQFRGSIAFLDTNFLFALLGLEGPFDEEIAKTALKFTKNLGIEVKVHSLSEKEYRRSLSRRGQELKTGKMPSREFAAEIVSNFIKKQGPIAEYYKAYTKTGISWDDWVKPFNALAARLEENNIEIVNWFEQEILKDERLSELTNDIFSVSDNYYKLLTSGQPLNIEICKHDALMLLLIDNVRKGKPEEFVGSKCWIISLDTKMPRYERLQKKQIIGGVPKFVLIYNWLQFVGPINPKTEDWNALARSLILSPYLQAPMAGAPSSLKIHMVAAKLSQYKNLSVHVATQVLLNDRLQKSMENISDEEFRKNVDKYIEEALLNEYYDKEKQLKDTREEKDDLQKEINKITIEKQETDKKISDMTDDIKVVKKQLNTFIIFGRRISSLLIIALLALVSILLDWNSLNTVSFTLAILGIIAGIVGIIGFLRNWNLALKTLLTISSILSLAAAIVTFKL